MIYKNENNSLTNSAHQRMKVDLIFRNQLIQSTLKKKQKNKKREIT